MALTPPTGWGWVRALPINNPVTDYQMKLELRRGSGTNSATVMYDDNKCYYSDMRDHRFGSTNNPSTTNQLPEWKESYTAGTPNIRIVWVKTNGNATIYFFAGNSGAGEYSDGDNTFVHYETFDGTDGTDPTGWSDPWGGWAIESNTYKTVSYSMKHAFVTGSSVLDAYVDVKFQIASTVAPYIAVCARKQSGTKECYWFSIRRWSGKPSSEGSKNYYYNGSSNTGLTGVQFALDGNWHDYTVCFHDNAFSVWWDGVQKINEASLGGHITTAGEIGLTQWDSGTRYADLFRVRKYASTPPTWGTFGSWQSLAVSSGYPPGLPPGIMTRLFDAGSL